MRDPLSIQQSGPDFLVAWDAFNVRVSKLKEHSDGYAGVFVVNIQGFPGYSDGKIFGPSKVNMSSSRTKSEVAKACLGRVPENDWAGVIESVCEIITEAIEAGSPIEDLGGETEIEPDRPYLAEPILREENTLLYGMGGTGKSLLSLALGASLADGSDYLGLGFVQPARVMYIDYEDEANTQRSRLESLRVSWGLPERPHVLYKHADASMATMGDSLARQIAQNHIDYLIIDSAAMACGADPEKADSATTFFRSLRSLGVKGTLTIGHMTKGNEKFPFGSVFWWNGPRSIWYAKNTREDDQSAIHLGLFHRKSNNGIIQKPIGLHIQFSNGLVSFRPEQVSEIAEFRAELSVWEKVRALIYEARRGLTLSDLQAAVRDIDSTVKPDTVRTTVRRAVERKKLQEHQGMYYLVTNMEQHA